MNYQMFLSILISMMNGLLNCYHLDQSKSLPKMVNQDIKKWRKRTWMLSLIKIEVMKTCNNNEIQMIMIYLQQHFN